MKKPWAVGDTVQVGFIRGLVVVARHGRGWLLMDSSCQLYMHHPYQGCYRLDKREAVALWESARDRVTVRPIQPAPAALT